MIIRECTKHDIKDVYNLICELEDETINYSNFEVVFKSKIADSRNHYSILQDNNLILGFISVNIDYQLHHEHLVATIEELVVTAKLRSQGYGKALLDYAINLASSLNCEVIELTSNFTRLKAHDFYERNGFDKSSFKFKYPLAIE